MSLAIDDVRTRKKAAAHDPAVPLLDAVGLLVEAIQARLLTDADAIKVDWETNHHFVNNHFKSLAELIP